MTSQKTSRSIIVRPALVILAISLAVAAYCWRMASKSALANSGNTSRPVAVQANTDVITLPGDRGGPHIRLQKALSLATSYAGDDEAAQLLKSSEARPLTLASADFDEDGIPDLIGGYGGPSGEFWLFIAATRTRSIPTAARLNNERRLVNLPTRLFFYQLAYSSHLRRRSSSGPAI